MTRSARPRRRSGVRIGSCSRALRAVGLLGIFSTWAAEAHGQQAAPVPSLQQQLGAKLREAVAEADRRLDGVMGLAIVDLKTGERILWNPDQAFPTASAIKAPILLELLRQSQQAELEKRGARLGDPYTPRAEDVIADSPLLAGMRFGTTRLTNQDLATFMIVVSDNAATNLLIDRVGMGAVNTTLLRLGLQKTRLRRKMLDAEAVKRGDENTATARELALFYERLYAGDVLDAGHRELLWQTLSLRKSGFLSAELPESVRIAHKPGSLDGARTDAGVIFVPGRPFVFTALIAYAKDGAAAERTISELARRAYEYFDRLGASTSYGRRAP